MVLESLLDLVETLRARIDEHGVALRQSEALTRATLIDPLLRELGWDTEDPALVMPEYRLGRGFADYALLSNSKPIVMVEAKKLGTPLLDAASQGIGYCIEDGIAYFAVTDGRHWEIYETHKMAPIAEKLIVQFDIAQSPPITCLKAMALWRPTVEHSSVIPAETPLVGLNVIERNVTELVASPPVPVPEPTTERAPVTVPKSDRTGQEWIPISQYMGKHREKPNEIMFPDGSVKELNRLNELLLEPVRWLHSNGFLNESECPIRQSPQAKNYVVASQEADITSSRRQYVKNVGHLLVDTGYNATQTVNCVKAIIAHVSQDPSQFKVRLPSQ